MKGEVTISSIEAGRKVTCCPSGRAAFWFSYKTTFGPNSAGFNMEFPTQEKAILFAKEWTKKAGEACVP